MLDRELAIRGAHRALTECIALSRGDSLALFYDDTTREFVDIICEAAHHLEIPVTLRCSRPEEEIRLAATNEIVDLDSDAINDARAVIFALGPSEGGRPYRRRLLERSVDDSRFVGVLPGATPRLLVNGVDIDYAKVESRCDELAMALLAGSHAEVVTTDERNGKRPETLHLVLGSFQRPPITSTGIIQRGAWGNLPGGETFIAPVERRAHGNFVLNGAFRGCVVDPTNPLVLTFQTGSLIRVQGPEQTKSQFVQLLQGKSGANVLPNVQLAELGIGINEGLHELTGDPLFDEKVSGTIHIAVGENAMYGGTLVAMLHEDFIARSPSLIIDGHSVLKDGHYALDVNDWLESWESLVGRGSHIEDNLEIARSGLHCNALPSGRFRVRRDVGAHRKCIYTIGDDQVSPMLCRLFQLIPAPPETVPVRTLMQRWKKRYGDISGDILRGLVAVLESHRIVECPAEETSSMEIS